MAFVYNKGLLPFIQIVLPSGSQNYNLRELFKNRGKHRISKIKLQKRNIIKSSEVNNVCNFETWKCNSLPYFVLTLHTFDCFSYFIREKSSSKFKPLCFTKNIFTFKI